MVLNRFRPKASHDGEANMLTKHKGVNTYNIMVLMSLCLGSITYGYTAAIIGSTLGQPQFIAYFALATRPNGTDLISTMNGLFYAGGVIGPLILPTVADKFGRKWSLVIGSVVCIFSGALTCGAVTVGMFIVGRFFAGASASMILASVPLLMNEIVPPHLRGTLVDLHGVFINVGYCIQGWVGFGISWWAGGSNTWRPTVGLQCLWPLLLLICIPFIPESPRWLCLQGREAEAEANVTKLHASKDDPDNEMAKAEFYQIKKQIAIDRTLGNSWMDMFRKPSYRRRAFLAMATTGIIQCSGPLVINNYGPSLYASLGFSPVKQLLYPAAWLTFAVGTNAMGMLFVDRFPRPGYMVYGVIGCEITLIVEAALVANFVPSDNQAAQQAAVAMFFIFQVFYGGALDGTQFAYIGELFPNHIRAKGVCLGVAMISLANVVWLQSAPTAFAHIEWKFYLVFIITGTVGALCIWMFFPDTAHKPLEEIAALFGDKHEVAIYQQDMEFDGTTGVIVDHGREGDADGGQISVGSVETSVEKGGGERAVHKA